ncbi:MAG: choice-of-anchor Q domain-containing protein [Rhizobacter sp.]
MLKSISSPRRLLHLLLTTCIAAIAACSGGDGGGTANAAGTPDGGVGTPQATLTLRVQVSGSGTVSSAPAGLACATDCSSSFVQNSAVTLAATPATGFSFAGWSGAGCRGMSTCAITLSANTTAQALFTATPALPTGSGKSFYVDPAGSDNNNGTSTTTPFRTVARAVSMVNPGDIIEVRAGTYIETLTIGRPGSSSAWITIRGYAGDARPIIKSTGSLPTIWFYTNACDESNLADPTGNTDCQAMYWVVQNLEIQGSPNGGADGNVIKIDTPKVRVISNKLCYAKVDIVKLVKTSNDVEILNNEICHDNNVITPTGYSSNAGSNATNAQGVDMVGADRVRVVGNYVHDMPDIGIYAKGNARNVVFEGNVLSNIGAHAIMVGQQTDADRMVDGPYETYDMMVRNNVVINAGWACVAVTSSKNAKVYNNSCYNTGTSVHGSIFLSNEAEVPQRNTNVEIVNNIIYGSAANPVIKIDSGDVIDFSTLTIDRNIYYVTGGAPKVTADSQGLILASMATWLAKYTTLTGGKLDSSLVVDPQFASTSPTSSPLTLKSTSPAINKGRSNIYVTQDRLGTARPQGAAVDIGAYEY